MLDILLALLLAAHLLLVDVVMAGPLVCIWLEWRETRHADPVAGSVGRALAGFVLWALAGGIAIGAILLAIRWSIDRPYFSALAAIPQSRLWFGLGELLFYFACMAAYRRLWTRLRNRRMVHRLLAIAAASNMLVHFPALFAIISVASTRPQLWGSTLDRAGYWRLLVDGEVLSRVTHVWLASFAVTGVALLVFAVRLAGDPEHHSSRARLISRGAWLGLVCTLLQIPSGLWLAFEMPEAAREPLFGGDLVASGLFAASVLLTLQLLHTLAAIALGDSEPKQVRRSVLLVVMLMLLMAGTRARLDGDALATRELPPPDPQAAR